MNNIKLDRIIMESKQAVPKVYELDKLKNW